VPISQHIPTSRVFWDEKEEKKGDSDYGSPDSPDGSSSDTPSVLSLNEDDQVTYVTMSSMPDAKEEDLKAFLKEHGGAKSVKRSLDRQIPHSYFSPPFLCSFPTSGNIETKTRRSSSSSDVKSKKKVDVVRAKLTVEEAISEWLEKMKKKPHSELEDELVICSTFKPSESASWLKPGRREKFEVLRAEKQYGKLSEAQNLEYLAFYEEAQLSCIMLFTALLEDQPTTWSDEGSPMQPQVSTVGATHAPPELPQSRRQRLQQQQKHGSNSQEEK